VQAFTAKLGLRKIEFLVGHSFGGRVAIKAIADGVLSPTRLVLIGSAGVRHSLSLRNQLFKALAKTGKAVAAIPGLSSVSPSLRRALYRSAGSVDYLDSGPLKQIFINTINEDLRDSASKITIPTLLIWGAQDTDTPPADGRILAKLISHSSFILVAKAGHYTHLDAPERVYQAIDEFTS
jgi:pimeloyl-ACP methyl ester carboxylesterase